MLARAGVKDGGSPRQRMPMSGEDSGDPAMRLWPERVATALAARPCAGRRGSGRLRQRASGSGAGCGEERAEATATEHGEVRVGQGHPVGCVGGGPRHGMWGWQQQPSENGGVIDLRAAVGKRARR